MDRKLIVIAGPTASGKTGISVKLAQNIGGEIVSADSMQIYRHMDIGSAKITEEEKRNIPHHMIDIADPLENYDVVRYKEDAKAVIEDIYSRDKIPVMAGGTGMYIDAVIRNISYGGFTGDPKLREELKEISLEKGNEYLHNILKKEDPEAASNIHMNNVKRVIRALEVTRSLGIPFSSMQREEKSLTDEYRVYYYYLNMDRQKLYERINQRVDIMMEKGLEWEVKKLISMGLTENHQSMQGIGYKEMIPYFRGEIGLSEAAELIRQHSRNYAKRQLTWFKNDGAAVELSLDTMSAPSVVEYITADIKGNS